MILQIGRVNSLVAHRAHLLRQGDDKGEAGWSVRRRAQEMVDELGGGVERDSGKVIFELPDPSAGKASRVRRGTNVSRAAWSRIVRKLTLSQVTRLALLIIVLCEILQVDLDDYRLLQARESALEMVADSEASETAGFSWALTVGPEMVGPVRRNCRSLTDILTTGRGRLHPPLNLSHAPNFLPRNSARMLLRLWLRRYHPMDHGLVLDGDRHVGGI